MPGRPRQKRCKINALDACDEALSSPLRERACACAGSALASRAAAARKLREREPAGVPAGAGAGSQKAGSVPARHLARDSRARFLVPRAGRPEVGRSLHVRAETPPPAHFLRPPPGHDGLLLVRRGDLAGSRGERQGRPRREPRDLSELPLRGAHAAAPDRRSAHALRRPARARLARARTRPVGRIQTSHFGSGAPIPRRSRR